MSGVELLGNLLSSVLSSATLHAAGVLILVSIFSISGISKLAKPSQAAEAIVKFGIGQRPARVAGVALGLWEIGIAALALVTPIGVGLVAASLAGFSVLIVRALGRRDSFECACLGVGSRVGPTTLVRALVLFLLAVYVLFAGVSTTIAADVELALALAGGAVGIPLGLLHG